MKLISKDTEINTNLLMQDYKNTSILMLPISFPSIQALK